MLEAVYSGEGTSIMISASISISDGVEQWPRLTPSSLITSFNSVV